MFPVGTLPVTLDVMIAFSRYWKKIVFSDCLTTDLQNLRLSSALVSSVPAIESFTTAAVEFFNAQSNTIKLEADFRDTFVQGCTSVAEDLVELDYHALIGAFFSECSIQMMDVLTPAAVVGVSPSSTTTVLSDKTQYPTAFRVITDSEFVATSVGKLVKELGFGQIVVVSGNVLQAVQESTSALVTYCEAHGISVVEVFMIDEDKNKLAIQEMLVSVWKAGVGVIVLNVYEEYDILLIRAHFFSQAIG